jgi:hypothetical protein
VLWSGVADCEQVLGCCKRGGVANGAAGARKM